MRTVLLPLVALLVATSGEAQICAGAPPPVLPDLFPERVADLPREFSSYPGGGCMALYRPPGSAENGAPWAVVSAEFHDGGDVGEDADRVRGALAGPDRTIVEEAGWPVAFAVRPLGDQFVTLKGPVRVTVLVKNGDHGAVSRDMALRVLEVMLARVPCG